MHVAAGDSTAYVQSIFDLIKPIAKAAVDLNAAGSRQARDRQKDLVARVAVLKDFLEKNPPADRHLVPDGTEYPLALLPEIELKARPHQSAAKPRIARSAFPETMFDRRILLTRLGPLSLIWVSLAAGGCTEELGPENLPVARVSGVVREGDRPVGGGWIEFIPVDETVGNLCSAKLGVDGSFNAKSVAVGVNLIRLVNAPLKTPGANQLVGAPVANSSQDCGGADRTAVDRRGR